MSAPEYGDKCQGTCGRQMYINPEDVTRGWVAHHKENRCRRCYQRYERERPITLEELPTCAGWCGRKVYSKKYLYPPEGAARVNCKGMCTACYGSPDGPPPGSYVMLRQQKERQVDITPEGLPMCAGWCGRPVAPRGSKSRPEGSVLVYKGGKCFKCATNPTPPPGVVRQPSGRLYPAALKPLPDPSTYTDEETAKARSGLDAYMAARANRLRAAAR